MADARGRDFVKFRALLYGFDVMHAAQESLSGFEAWQRGVEAFQDYLATYDRRHRPVAKSWEPAEGFYRQTWKVTE